MNRQERLQAGYSNVLDTLARWTSRVDNMEAAIEKNREWLTDERIKKELDSIARSRAEIAQERAKVEAQAREFGLIE